MAYQFSRTQLILGEEAMKKLSESRVAVFGIGGVGGHAVEALVRSGIGAIDVIDNDTVSETNINRQIVYWMRLLTKTVKIKIYYPSMQRSLIMRGMLLIKNNIQWYKIPLMRLTTSQ